jgi:hypothetical protein
MEEHMTSWIASSCLALAVAVLAAPSPSGAHERGRDGTAAAATNGEFIEEDEL